MWPTHGATQQCPVSALSAHDPATFSDPFTGSRHFRRRAESMGEGSEAEGETYLLGRGGGGTTSRLENLGLDSQIGCASGCPDTADARGPMRPASTESKLVSASHAGASGWGGISGDWGLEPTSTRFRPTCQLGFKPTLVGVPTEFGRVRPQFGVDLGQGRVGLMVRLHRLGSAACRHAPEDLTRWSAARPPPQLASRRTRTRSDPSGPRAAPPSHDDGFARRLPLDREQRIFERQAPESFVLAMRPCENPHGG